MFAIVKLTLFDFEHENKVCCITDNKEKAKEALKKEIEKEKALQEKEGFSYDTEHETDVYYEAYNEGYELTDSVHISIEEAEFLA